jgi:hypothetical protein
MSWYTTSAPASSLLRRGRRACDSPNLASPSLSDSREQMLLRCIGVPHAVFIRVLVSRFGLSSIARWVALSAGLGLIRVEPKG